MGKVRVVAGYALQQRLGSGSFATVYKGIKVPDSVGSAVSRDDTDNSSPQPEIVAIKAIERTSEKLTKKVLQNLEIEISILRTYRHPNIVCMHNVQKTDRHFYLVLEYCGGGDVQRLIRTRKDKRLSERLTRRLMRDLSAGLKFLWGQELIHRDIKPQNLLLTGALPLDELNDPARTPEEEAKRQQIDFPSEQFALKIADFGFARHLQTASLAETLCGSPLYMAPEILQHHRYDAKADLWSVGTVMYEMITGRPPFNGANHIDLLRNIERNAVRLPRDVRVSKACVTLLRHLLSRNPLSRAGFQQFFEDCDAFVALGCEGVATQDAGTCRIPSTDLGTIPENDGGTPVPPSGSESLMTVSTAGQPMQQQNKLLSLPQPNQAVIKPSRVVSPPFNSMTSPSTLIPNANLGGNPQGLTRQYPNRLSPLAQSPPSSGPLVYHGARMPPVIPPLGAQPKQPWQQTTYSTDLTQARRTEMTQSQASTDESGFVMVDRRSVGGALAQQSPTNGVSQQHYFLNTPPVVTGRSDYNHFRGERRMPPKGMLSTSPGTGGLLMGLMGRPPRIGYDPSKRFGDEVATVNKMLATAEDVGRRAVSVAHLGDTRAYLGMRLVQKNEEGSSLLSTTPMEGVEEEPHELASSHGGLSDDSSSTEIMAPARRRSSVSTDRVMTVAEDDQTEEMPFAITPEAPAVELPSRSNLSVYNKSTSMSSVKKKVSKPDPQTIRSHFGEALSCYLKALKMLKGAVGAAKQVSKDLESLVTQIGRSPTEYNIPSIQKRCEVTSTWLCGQFRGVLERADAANVEIVKFPAAGHGKEATNVTSVEELIYNHALSSGRDGAVKQLLGQYDASRTCYRSAGLLAETLLMEANVGAEDRKILEGYVDGFAARITELDQLMLQQSRLTGSSNTTATARCSGVIGLIGPPPSVPTGFLVNPNE